MLMNAVYINFILGNASINNDTMVTVTVMALQCGVQYTIIAGGIYNNGTVVGPATSYENTVINYCPTTGENLLQVKVYVVATYTYVVICVLSSHLHAST